MSKSITHQGRTYRKRKGLEGPFLYLSGPGAPGDSGVVLYYDKAEGMYYDSAHDLYIDPPGGDPARMLGHISKYVPRGKKNPAGRDGFPLLSDPPTYTRKEMAEAREYQRLMEKNLPPRKRIMRGPQPPGNWRPLAPPSSLSGFRRKKRAPDFHYFVVDPGRKTILSGWWIPEEAEDSIDERDYRIPSAHYKALKVYDTDQVRSRMKIDPQDWGNWEEERIHRAFDGLNPRKNPEFHSKDWKRRYPAYTPKKPNAHFLQGELERLGFEHVYNIKDQGRARVQAPGGGTKIEDTPWTYSWRTSDRREDLYKHRTIDVAYKRKKIGRFILPPEVRKKDDFFDTPWDDLYVTYFVKARGRKRHIVKTLADVKKVLPRKPSFAFYKWSDIDRPPSHWGYWESTNPGSRKKNPRKAAPVDKYAARQLVLFAENHYDLWERRRPEFLKNMARKIKSGKLDVSKLPKLWKYFADEAAKDYQAEFGRDWAFSPATRRAAAKVFAEDALGEFESGDITPAKLLRKR
jgi:hypothetical protein